jgi:hypothetical protein
VSTEWAAHCLGLGEIIPPDLHSVFTLPSDRLKNSRAFKIAEKDGGGRYIIGDIVYFKTTKLINEPPARHVEDTETRSRLCHEQYLHKVGFKYPVLMGRIVSFVRHHGTDAVQVKICPLRVRCLECESGSSTSSPLMAASPAGYHHTYELNMDTADRDIIISSNLLAPYHPAVLSSNSYQRFAYSSCDKLIYLSSPLWEGAMVYHTDSDYSQDDGQSVRPINTNIQQSQDY